MSDYVNSLRELGTSDSDFEGGGSDALIDAVVPWVSRISWRSASPSTTGPARTTSRSSPWRRRWTSSWKTCAGWHRH